MHFNFALSSVLNKEISKITRRDVFYRRGIAMKQHEELSAIIDQTGENSAIARDLPQPVTAADKLKEDQIIYLLIDPAANDGTGELISMLKIGPKHLFVHDEYKIVHERSSTCVLDFYVDETKQRMGYGKRIFDYMLEDQHLPAHKLPVDTPSAKLIAFLKKHYHLHNPISQVNNYVVYAAFFSRDNAEMTGQGNASEPVTSFQRRPVTVKRHSSNVGNLIHNNMDNVEITGQGNTTRPVTIYQRRPVIRHTSNIGDLIHNNMDNEEITGQDNASGPVNADQRRPVTRHTSNVADLIHNYKN